MLVSAFIFHMTLLRYFKENFSFMGKRLSILASCMTNLSEFHIVFSSSALIHMNKDALEGHLCQTVNNFVKHNKSSLLSPLRKRLNQRVTRNRNNDLEQGSGMYGSRARCGSFDDCIWLADQI